MAINYQASIVIRDFRQGDWFWIHKSVWKDTRLSASDKVIYGTLAFFANQHQSAWPSFETLGEFSGISERQVYRSIKQLGHLGYIRITRGGGKGISNEYQLLEIKGDMKSPFTPNPDKSTPQTLTNNTSNKNILTTRILSKDSIGETPAVKEVFGNKEVEEILKEFTRITGLSRPADVKPRQWAYILAKGKGIGVSGFTGCLTYLQDTKKLTISKLETVFRQFPVYQRDVVGFTTDPDRQLTEEEQYLLSISDVAKKGQQ